MTKVHHHPSDSTLLEYASGALTEAACVVVAMHLRSCTACRATVALGEELGGAVFEALPSEEMSANALNLALDQVSRDAPEAIEPVATSSIGDPSWLKGPLSHYDIGRWRWLAPGIHRIRVFSRRRGGLDLLRVAPGKSIPVHGHRGAEFTYVLDGGFTDGPNRFGPGDFAETDESVEHCPVADLDGACVCLIASDQRIRLRGLARLVQPFIGV